MQLEQKLYQSCKDEQEETERQRIYTTGDLETLSVNVLYSLSKPLRAGSLSRPLRPLGLSRPLDASNLSGGSSLPILPSVSRPLTIRDFPESGFQLHIHEGPGGSANIKAYGESKGQPISSYDAAIADLFVHKLSEKEKIEELNALFEKYGINIHFNK